LHWLLVPGAGRPTNSNTAILLSFTIMACIFDNLTDIYVAREGCATWKRGLNEEVKQRQNEQSNQIEQA
jgi:hypothetical protein